MKKFVPSLVGFWIAIFGTTVASEVTAEELIFVAPDSAPLIYSTGDGVEGLFAEIIQSISKEIGRPIDIRLMDFRAARQKVLDGEADGVGPIATTQTRRGQFAVTNEIFSVNFTVFVREDRQNSYEWLNRENVQIGVFGRGTSKELALKNYPNAQLVEFTDVGGAFRALELSNVDAVIFTRRNGLQHLRDNDISQIVPLPVTLLSTPVGIGVMKTDTSLVGVLNTAIHSLHKNGQISDILRKWDRGTVVFFTKAQITYLISTAGVLFGIFIALLVGFYVVKLRRTNISLANQIIEKQAIESELREIQNQLEQRVEDRTRDLQKTADKFREVIDSAADAIFVIDITHSNSGTIVDVNTAACENLGYSRSELLEMSVPDIEVELTQFERDLNYSQIGHKVSTLKGSHRRKDGTTFPISIRSKTFFDGDRKYAVALARDETDWQIFEEDLRLAKKRAEDAQKSAESASKTKSEFLANMSHELRSPLTAILGFTEMMQHGVYGKVENERYQDYIENIHDSSSHLLSLINQLLDISALESGKLEIKEDEVHLAFLVHAVVDLLQPNSQERNITVAVTTDPEDLLVCADELRAKQVLINVVSNAIKFTPENGEIAIRTKLTKDGGGEILVKDNGIGMSAEQVEIALTRFGQIDSTLAREQEGTGIGLPLSKSLVEAQNGRFKIVSRQNSGTQVSIWFPIHPSYRNG